MQNKERLAWAVLIAAGFLHFHGGFDFSRKGHELHVLINVQAGQKYTKDQQEAIADAQTGKIHEWLDANATKINGVPERRVWDTAMDTTGESNFWQEAEKHNHGTLPSVEISTDGKKWNPPVTFTNPNNLQSILSAKKGDEYDVTAQ